MKNTLLCLAFLLLCGCGGGGSGGGSTVDTKADLTLSGTSTLGLGSSAMVEGSSYTLTVNVNNIGNQTAIMGWFIKTETSNADSATEEITSNIGPGGSAVYTIEFIPEASDVGTLTITLTADINGQVDESNESNNTFTSGTFNVAALILAPAADN